MNDLRLARILKTRAQGIKGCSAGDTINKSDGCVFRVEADTGAIFEVRVTVYKDALG